MSALKKQLTEKILGIAGVTQQYLATDSGGFTWFVFGKRDFAHFHAGNELDLRLTKKVIAAEKLKHPKDSVAHPNRASGSPWIELRFNSKAEVLEVYRLVELAIKQI